MIWVLTKRDPPIHSLDGDDANGVEQYSIDYQTFVNGTIADPDNIDYRDNLVEEMIRRNDRNLTAELLAKFCQMHGLPAWGPKVDLRRRAKQFLGLDTDDENQQKEFAEKIGRGDENSLKKR